MMCAHWQPTNAEKRQATVFQVVCCCGRVQQNLFNPVVLQLPKGPRFFSHQGYLFDINLV